MRQSLVNYALESNEDRKWRQNYISTTAVAETDYKTVTAVMRHLPAVNQHPTWADEAAINIISRIYRIQIDVTTIDSGPRGWYTYTHSKVDERVGAPTPQYRINILYDPQALHYSSILSSTLANLLPQEVEAAHIETPVNIYDRCAIPKYPPSCAPDFRRCPECKPPQNKPYTLTCTHLRCPNTCRASKYNAIPTPTLL